MTSNVKKSQGKASKAQCHGHRPYRESQTAYYRNSGIQEISSRIDPKRQTKFRAVSVFPVGSPCALEHLTTVRGWCCPNWPARLIWRSSVSFGTAVGRSGDDGYSPAPKRGSPGSLTGRTVAGISLWKPILPSHSSCLCVPHVGEFRATGWSDLPGLCSFSDEFGTCGRCGHPSWSLSSLAVWEWPIPS